MRWLCLWVVASVIVIASSSAAIEAECYGVEHPCFSPDGRTIIFASDHDGNLDLYRIGSNGSGLRRLTDGEAYYSRPVFSQDGRYIACERSDFKGNDAVMVTNADGSNPHVITKGKSSQWAPAWLPNGKGLIVVTSGEQSPDLLLITSSGDTKGYVARNAVQEGSPSCSPDGSWVAYEVVDDSQGLNGDQMQVHICKRSLAGAARPPVQLTSGRIDRNPRISPKGDRIVYAGSQGAVWVMKSDGSGSARVPAGDGQALDPCWSPNGTQIAFVKSMDIENHEITNRDVYMVSLKGTGLTQVTHTVARARFSSEARTYPGTQTVTITCDSPGAIIRYTTDGSNPTKASPLYSKPILVDHSLTLKARAWKTDWFPSHVKSAQYVMK